MTEIINKDPNELAKKSKNKKIKMTIKKTILGILISSGLISTIPNMRYYLTKQNANKNTYFTQIINSDDSQESKLLKVYALGIDNNKNLSDEEKSKLIEAFKNEVAKGLAPFADNEFLKNIYAVTSTETIHFSSEFTKNHDWWAGYYNPYLNSIEYDDLDNSSIIAHEQMHAITKSGIFSTGLVSKSNYTFGYGMNEGVTAFFGKKDDSYGYYQEYIQLLGDIYGYDKILKFYINGDLNGLISLLSENLSKDEAIELVHAIDDQVFTEFEMTFIHKNFPTVNIDSLQNRLYKNEGITIDLVSKTYAKCKENKEFSNVEKDSIENNLFVLDPRESNIDIYNKILTTVEFKNLEQKKVKFETFELQSGIFIINYNGSQKGKEYLTNLQEYFSKITNCNLGGFWMTDSKFVVQRMEFVVNNNDLNNFNYQNSVDEVISSLNTLPNITVTPSNNELLTLNQEQNTNSMNR